MKYVGFSFEFKVCVCSDYIFLLWWVKEADIQETLKIGTQREREEWRNGWLEQVKECRWEEESM